MTLYIRDGSRFNVTADANIDIHNTLPAGNYTVKFDDFRKCYYLDQVEAFRPVKKVYGNCQSRSTRIINTFLERESSTGVVLNGEKGSGKTLLARQLSMDLAEQGVPTIIINSDYCGDLFNQFIQSIAQPAVILFDEFEKVYDKEHQEQILTLFDGVYPTKKLFVLTCNDKYRIDSHMRNRPGRIYYMIDFAGLDREFIAEYCQDNLVDASKAAGVMTISALFSEFNFDSLKALVEEMNRYNETAADAIQMLNAKPTTDDSGRYDTVMTNKEGEVLPLSSNVWNGNPLRNPKLGIWTDYPDGDKDFYTEFHVGDLVKVDADNGCMIFRNADGFTWTFKRQSIVAFNYHAL